MFKHILLPTDGSELAAAAARRGVALAKEIGAKVTFLAVVEPLHVLTANPAGLRESLAAIDAAADKQARASVLACEAEAKAAGVEARGFTAHDEHPAAEIVAVAEREGCDLIAMASHGRRGLTKLMLGSQTQRVVSSASVPVLVFR
jgi:nucleotide-binding universal stress UspA family protein